MTAPYRLRPATADPATAGGLADLLLDCVAGGASVGFLAPLARDQAVEFWAKALAAAAAGRRVVLVAEDAVTGELAGTVSVVFAAADNQPHRADVAKLQVHRRHRRRGLGEVLVRAAEDTARAAGRTLLVLDAVTDSDAARLYARLGWVRVGDIPNYALFPDGRPCATTVFYRDLSGLPDDPAGQPDGAGQYPAGRR